MTELAGRAIANETAEWSVLARMFHEPSKIGEIVGTQLEAADFYRTDAQLIFATLVEHYYGGQSYDPITVGDMLKGQLSAMWGGDPSAVPDMLRKKVDALANVGHGQDAVSHAKIVRRLSSSRQLMAVAWTAVADLDAGKLTPEQVGDYLSTEALRITSGLVARSEIDSWMDLGRYYATYMARLKKAKELGIEMAVYTGLDFIDDHTKGIAPTELCFIGGEPGSGKSGVAWCAALGFAGRQLKKPQDQQIGTLILSMEMGKVPSAARLVSTITGIDGMRLREGDITQGEFQHLLREWKNRENLPLHFNFASNFRLSQMRALIVESIRRHNVGFVVIDHFRMMDTDERFQNSNQEDEAKVRFLKENIAKDLNIAVMCLAHTVKIGRSEDQRPQLNDLRGSGQVAAHADFVGFVYRPTKYMGEEEKMSKDARDDDAEMVWRKNRHGTDGVAKYTFDAAHMRVFPRGTQYGALPRQPQPMGRIEPPESQQSLLPVAAGNNDSPF